VLLLTGATGLVGSALLRRLTARGEPVRCMVRDPRRLGSERVRVQITIGDLTDARAYRQALRGARTVVHLAASPRDQPHATIEELAGLATWRLLRAAEAAGVEHFVFFSALGASPTHRSRLHRSKAIAEQAVAAAELRTTTFAPSLVYSPGDRRLGRLERLAWLPAVPLAGLGRARTQPIWADDVADCVLAALDGVPPPGHARYELAGPDVLTHREIAELTLRAAHRRRRLVPVPTQVLRPLLRGYEALTGPAAWATWDEAELLGVSMRTARGTADAEALGVHPRRFAAVVGA
jgi:NADH dehydrogenase